MKIPVLADSATALALLQRATAGLLYMTESDEPFVPVMGPGDRQTIGPEDARALIGRAPGEGIAELSTADFFAEPAKRQDWHGPTEKLVVECYRALQSIFEDQLADAKVFRLGEVRIDVLIMGKTADGHWVGLRTLAVET